MLPGLTGLAIALTVGAIVIAPLGVARGRCGAGPPGQPRRAAPRSGSCPPRCRTALELAALRRLPASVFSVLMSLEPAMGALSGLVFLGQNLRWQDWLAIGCVMVASVGATGRMTEAVALDVPTDDRDGVAV